MTALAYVLLYLLVLIFLTQYTHGGPTCLSCNNIATATDCRYTQICGSHETCYTDKFVTPNGVTRITVGCRDTRHCHAAQGRRSFNKSRDARASNNILVCTDCCQGDLCNSALCGQQGYTRERGPLCYQCNLELTPSDCNEMTQCGSNEVCSLKIRTTSSGGLRYSLGCDNKQVCKQYERYMQSMQILVGKRRSLGGVFQCAPCCNTDLCNNHCSRGTGAATMTPGTTRTTETTVTTTVTSAPLDACSSKPCVHGRCALYLATYLCTCLDGITGRNCDQDHQSLSPCMYNPCVHGTCISDARSGYVCTCRSGFHGTNCDMA